jgi:hypothetical protein
MDSKVLDQLLDEHQGANSSAKGDKSLSQKMKSKQDFGKVDSFRHTILSLVADEDYANAIKELKLYIDSKPEFPQFKERSERYISYSIDLINGIRAKRSFPGIKQLAMSKQQELYDRAVHHFEDLNVTLRKVDQIDNEVRLEDIRSTVWVVKAVVHSTLAILVLAFLLEMSKGILGAAGVLADDLFGKITNTIFNYLGF